MEKDPEQAEETMFSYRYNLYLDISKQPGGLEKACVEWLIERSRIDAAWGRLPDQVRIPATAMRDAGDRFFIKEERWRALQLTTIADQDKLKLLTEFIGERQRIASFDPHLQAFIDSPPPRPPQNIKEVFQAAEDRLNFYRGQSDSKPSWTQIEEFFRNLERDFRPDFNRYHKEQSEEDNFTERRARQRELAQAMWDHKPELLRRSASMLRNSPEIESDIARRTALLEEADRLLAPPKATIPAQLDLPSDTKAMLKAILEQITQLLSTPERIPAETESPGGMIQVPTSGIIIPPEFLNNPDFANPLSEEETKLINALQIRDDRGKAMSFEKIAAKVYGGEITGEGLRKRALDLGEQHPALLPWLHLRKKGKEKDSVNCSPSGDDNNDLTDAEEIEALTTGKDTASNRHLTESSMAGDPSMHITSSPRKFGKVGNC